jgi:hypothetical protein
LDGAGASTSISSPKSDMLAGIPCMIRQGQCFAGCGHETVWVFLAVVQGRSDLMMAKARGGSCGVGSHDSGGSVNAFERAGACRPLKPLLPVECHQKCHGTSVPQL